MIEADWEFVSLHLTSAGHHIIEFDTVGKPVIIQVDPEFLVPKMIVADNS